MNIVEVNGVKYTQNESDGTNRKMGGKLASLVLMAQAMGGMAGMGGFGEKPFTPPTNDIGGEYALIQRKESKLSSNARKWVVAQFERNFTKVENQ